MSQAPVSFDEALRDRGYVPILAIGFKEAGEDYRIKIAASPVLRMLSEETYGVLLETIVNGLLRLHDVPLDDLEIQ